MTDAGRTGSRFRTTRWTLILRARDSREDLGELLGLYWAPVYSFLRQSGRQPADAADLTQAFLSLVVMERGLVGQADPARGRFRTFLIAALKRFVIDEHRREHGRDGNRLRLNLQITDEQREAAEPVDGDDPTVAFDRQWAATVLSIALDRLRDSCLQDGLDLHWQAFERCRLHPAVHGTEAPPLKTVAAELGLEGPEKVSIALHTIRRKVRPTLRDVIAETVEDDSEVEAELGELQRYLSL